MIFVAGGTGRLGRLVVDLLLQSGESVRVLTRDRERAKHLPAAIEVVVGDLGDPSAVASAVRGCATAISAVHGFVGPGNPSPEAIDRDGNRTLIRAAKEAGVERLVLLSVNGARADHPMSLHRAKYAAEQELRASGLAFTIVRPTAFLETWLDVIGAELATKGRALVFGPGKNPINFVSVRDVAALVTRCALGRSFAGETIDIGGPENLAFVTVAERLIEASGRPGRIKHIPLPILRVMSVVARPMFPMFARQARAAVVLNTMDMTFAPPSQARVPAATTTLTDILAARSHTLGLEVTGGVGTPPRVAPSTE